MKRLQAWLVAAWVMASACSYAQDALDEAGQWGVTAGSGAAGTIEKADAPAPLEGKTALRCAVDETKKGYAYFRLTPPSADLTRTPKLRFRLHGGLQHSSLIELVIHDNHQRYSKWQTQLLVTRSREPRWTEFVVYLDSPTLDKGADLREATSITWRVHVAGGEGTRSFFLDGVRLEPSAPSAAPGPEQVVLEHKGCQAVFSKPVRFELVRLRTSTGETIPVSTATRMMPLASVPPDAVTVTIGGDVRWKKVEATPDRLRVEYEQGDYAFENTYAWEGDALAVRRRVTVLRDGRGAPHSRLHVVSFAGPLDRFTYDHGPQASTDAFPTKGYVPLPGNWLAASAEGGMAAAVVFPRRVLNRYAVEDRQLLVTDGSLWNHDLSAGMRLEHELWIVPLATGAPEAHARAATKAIAARLVESSDSALTYFLPACVSHGLEGQTLARGNGFTLWQAPSGVTVSPEQPCESAAADSQGLRVALARGETEPLHLVLSASRPMKNVSVTCSALTADGRTIPADRFRVRYASYVRIRRTTDAERAKTPAPKLAEFVGEIDEGAAHLLTDRFYASEAYALGPVEDPLFDAASVNVQLGRNQPVWITLTAPPSAPPGQYRGEIRLLEDGRELCRVPLEVKVWAFTLPRVASLRTWYQLWLTTPARPFWREYYRDLAEHKVSGFGGIPASTVEDGKVIATGPHVTVADGKVAVDWARFDQVAAYLFDEMGMRHSKLPHGQRGGGHVNVRDFAGLKEGTPEFEKAFHDYLCQARRHLSERGWLAGMDCYIFDEPDRERIEVVRRCAAIIRRAIPEVRIFPACAHNTRSLIGILNAWCPPTAYFGLPTGDFRPERIAEGRKRGETFWWYNQADNCLGAPVIPHRALPWASWNAGVAGYFVWTINNWGGGAFPWATSLELGEAMALYPGKSGPVDSIRWEQTREGLEDYDYLMMLENAVEKGNMPAPLSQRGRTALERARRLLPDPRCLIAASPREMLDIRAEIGEILDQTAPRPE